MVELATIFAGLGAWALFGWQLLFIWVVPVAWSLVGAFFYRLMNHASL
jgi:hypothetical protein